MAVVYKHTDRPEMVLNVYSDASTKPSVCKNAKTTLKCKHPFFVVRKSKVNHLIQSITQDAHLIQHMKPSWCFANTTSEIIDDTAFPHNLKQLVTVNSEIFARVLFSRNFVKLKPSRNGKITLPFTDIGISCPSREFLTS